VLLTVGSAEAQRMLAGALPPRVIVQHQPFDSPLSVRLFLASWRPSVGVFLVGGARRRLVCWQTRGRCLGALQALGAHASAGGSAGRTAAPSGSSS
jgi:hypothetical protein